MPLKILIISWYFPPFNTMGALRTGKLAKFLYENGHDVRVLCARDLPLPRTLSQQFPEERVVRTNYRDINGLPKLVQKFRVRLGLIRPAVNGDEEISPQGAVIPSQPKLTSPIPQPSTLARLLRKLRLAYQRVLNFPDPQIGWLPGGIFGGRKLLKEWRPDVIFATAPPFTTLFIARHLARKFCIPWVAEFRDRWSEDPYDAKSGRQARLQERVENWLLKDTRGLVTVSEPWAQSYRERFEFPVANVMNGYDPEEFPEEYYRGLPDPNTLRIVYTGILYPDRRDPSPLFAALKLMGEKASVVRVEFYGANRAILSAMAEHHNVTHLVAIHDRVAYEQSIRLQMQADILLLMQWNDPKEQGNVPGKLFEYIGARRPVLALGLADGVPAKVLEERGAGVLANDPEAIARHLQTWINQKKQLGKIPLVPVEARSGLSRPDQYRDLEALLKEVVDQTSEG